MDKSELVKTQLEQSFETSRAQFALLVQVITILALGNITVIGYAISAQIAGIVLIGALFPLMVLYLLYRMNKLALPIVYTATNIEKKYGGEDVDWLASTYAANIVTKDFVDKLKAIGAIPQLEERTGQLRKLKPPLIGGNKGLKRGVLILLAIGQISAPVILARYFSWRIF